MTQPTRQFDRRALFATGSAAALLAAVGVSAQAAPTRGGHLRVALSGGNRSETWLDLPGGRFLQAARNAVFETLTEIAPDGTLQPGLATAWAARNGGKTWTFSLRQNVHFHDGAPLTAEDVAASLLRHDAVKDVETDITRNTVQVFLAHQDASFPLTVSDGGWPVFSAPELAGGGVPMQGTGLYQIVRFDPGRGFYGQRVSSHRKDGDAGWFDSVELIAISDDAVRAEAVRDGYVDAADLQNVHDLNGHVDIELLSDAGGDVRGALRSGVLHATRLGPHPLDAMRFATRWWMQA